jgi:FkbM family methyltransferase
LSTTARQLWLKLLRHAGVKHFRATSGLGLPFICHVGDFAGEVPFYYPAHSKKEIVLMAAWCGTFENPVIVDVGANNGFIATQLAQLLRARNPRIYAFEPVPTTFAHLKLSIDRLGLDEFIVPICGALSDSNGIAKIFYNHCESLFAQVRADSSNTRAGSCSTLSPTMMLDQALGSLAVTPLLIKVDVEGLEAHVLRGAVNLLSQAEPPALSFEWNPLTASEVNSSLSEIPDMLPGYRLYYIDDFEGQRKPFGTEIAMPTELAWACNIFAVPRTATDKWERSLSAARDQLASYEA